MWLGAAAAVVVLLVGAWWLAQGGAGSTGQADCDLGLLFDGGEYVQHGFVEEVGPALGSGSYAVCEDVGADAAGLVFRDGGEEVEVWSLPDVPSADAVAVGADSAYTVLVNQNLGAERRAELAAELGLVG